MLVTDISHEGDFTWMLVDVDPVVTDVADQLVELIEIDRLLKEAVCTIHVGPQHLFLQLG